ncbi:MAG: hypothetical protein KGL39_34610 [Patescibacteria group bacterium]|nr:hypothetical protein [Patescibacteria group bacterium]
MPNMTYCRFQNTVRDLADCERALSDEMFGDLSEAEQTACRRMYKLCKQFVETFENDSEAMSTERKD